MLLPTACQRHRAGTVPHPEGGVGLGHAIPSLASALAHLRGDLYPDMCVCVPAWGAVTTSWQAAGPSTVGAYLRRLYAQYQDSLARGVLPVSESHRSIAEYRKVRCVCVLGAGLCACVRWALGVGRVLGAGLCVCTCVRVYVHPLMGVDRPTGLL